MSLRFFADHCVPTLVISTLRSEGYEVHRLTEYLPPDSADSVVIQEALRRNMILLTFDSDFSDIVAYPPESYDGIITFQVHNHPEVIPEILKHLLAYLKSHSGMSEYKGKILFVELHRIRIRP
jgi:predicted nuclease of predicted toxin-antitoxin system